MIIIVVIGICIGCAKRTIEETIYGISNLQWLKEMFVTTVRIVAMCILCYIMIQCVPIIAQFVTNLCELIKQDRYYYYKDETPEKILQVSKGGYVVKKKKTVLVVKTVFGIS